ncbi:hypothetical protein GIB67_009897 [Kingdonia uniflora]|uniref:Uncharacterized protein n=1 Tax=Kingdonia uniflora TaxID=39325 RepID=A0A7J7L7Z2_9MAGN|nr:hypothetical protein GIB67_009897 [Kingdonia uniflora]
MVSTQRERLKISGINQEISEGNKRLKRAKGSGSHRWEFSSVVRGKLESTANLHLDTEEYILKMGRLSIDEVSTSGRMNESDSGGEGGLEQFPSFPYQLVSYPPGSDAFREFCKAKRAIGGKWGKYLEIENRDRGIEESISLEYFDGDVWSGLSEGFLCYLTQFEYGLSLPLTNLAKTIINTIGACPIQMNRNMWEVITMCDHLNERWEKEERLRRITPVDVLLFYRVKNFKSSVGSYFCAKVTWRRFFDLNSAGRTWNDNIIWVKGVKFTLERKESLLDEVAEEETELDLVLGELGLRRKKRVEREKVIEGRSASMDDLKEVEERARLAIHQGKDYISQMVEEKANLDETAEERNKLDRHLMLKGYSQKDVDAIMADTYVKDEGEEA